MTMASGSRGGCCSRCGRGSRGGRSVSSVRRGGGGGVQQSQSHSDSLALPFGGCAGCTKEAAPSSLVVRDTLALHIIFACPLTGVDGREFSWRLLHVFFSSARVAHAIWTSW